MPKGYEKGVPAEDVVAVITVWDEPVGLKLLVWEGSYCGEWWYVVKAGRLATAISADEKVEVRCSVTRLVNLAITAWVHGLVPFMKV